MCGLAGCLDLDARHDRATLLALAGRMATTLDHRGPDDHRCWADAGRGLALAFRRLAIVDLSPAGAQPMLSASGRSVIAFNGEIYNAPELRARLAGEGHVLRGRSDTEVLLEACEAWGVADTVQRIEGMYAFAHYDLGARRLSLVRDPFGIKPLYLWRDGRRLLFASQPKAFRVAPGFAPRVDPAALSAFVRLGWVPGPLAMLAGVRQLAPGTILTVESDGREHAAQGWSIEAVARRGRESGAAAGERAARATTTRTGDPLDALEAAIEASVRRQMIADVPLGAFLSGGIDSSLVTALMQRVAGRRVQSFTIGFDEPAFDEAPHARAVARHLGTEHAEHVVGPRDAQALLADLPTWFDEPLADASQIPTLLLSRHARGAVTVALSGDGGDELFAGYARYRQAERLIGVTTRFPWLVAGASHLARGLAASGLPERIGALAPGPLAARGARWTARLAAFGGTPAPALAYRTVIGTGLDPARLLLAPAGPEDWWPSGDAWQLADPVALCQLVDTLTYLPDDVLAKVDRASMAVGLEVRPPLLDRTVAELAWRLPRDQLMRNGQGKWALREILARHVPRSLFERPKMGFGVPLAGWLRGPLRGFGEDLLDARRLGAAGHWRVEAVRALWARHQAGEDWHHQLWCILSFEMWRRRWMAP